MPDIDTELASALRAAKAKPMHFAFVAKGASEGRLFAAKTPIPVKKVNQAKAEMRGGQIFKGRCFGEDGQLIFEVPKEPPATLAKLLKKVISDSTGLMLRVEFRVSQDLEEGTAPPAAPPPPAPAAAPPPSAPSPTPGKLAVLKRLRALAEPYQAAVAAKGPDVPRMQALFGAVKGLVDNKDIAQANKVLDELESLVARAQPAPPEAPPAPPAGPGKLAVLKRMRALAEPYQAALVANGPDVPRMQALFGAVKGLVDTKDFAQAGKVLDELEPLVARAKAAPPAPPAGPGKLAVLKRMRALAEPYLAAVAAKGPEVPRMQTLFGAVKGLIDNKDFAQAAKVLDELEPLVARSQAAPPGAPPADDGPARFTTRLKALLPQIQRAQAGTSPVSQEIKLRMSEANVLARKKDFGQANALLDQIEALLKQAPGAGGSDLAAEWKKNLAAWTPAIKAALVAKGPNAAAIAKLLAQASALSKPGGDMAQALAKLTECHALATNVPPAAKPEEPAASPEETAANAELAAEFETLLKTLRPRLTRVLESLGKSDPAEAAGLDAQFARVLSANQAGNVVVAYDLLTTLDARLTTLMRTLKAAADIRKAAGPENVAFVVSKQEWDSVRQNAHKDLAKFQQAVLNDPETKADERFEAAIAPAINALGKVLEDFNNDLNVQLDKAAGLPADQKAPAIEEALNLIDGYRRKVETSEEIAGIDSGVYGPFSIGGSLTAALDKMAARLKKRLKTQPA